jgi:TRAP-type C4-dicarboxylate transport system substrate-binding protein
VNTVMRKTFKKMDAQNRKDNQNAFAALEKQGIKTVSPDDTQLAEWQATGASAAKNFAAQGKIDPALVTRLQGILAEFRAAN